MKDVGGAEQLYQYARKYFIPYLMDLPLSILKSGMCSFGMTPNIYCLNHIYMDNEMEFIPCILTIFMYFIQKVVKT